MGLGERIEDAVEGFIFIVFLWIVIITAFAIGGWALLANIALAAILIWLSLLCILRKKTAKLHKEQAKSVAPDGK